MRHYVWLTVLSAVIITGCSTTEVYNPMARFESGNTEVMEGIVLPLSINITTDATHRLERNGRMIGFLASDIVDLTTQEGQYSSISGVFEPENGRQIFWVRSIEPLEQGPNSTPKEDKAGVYTTDTYNFTYPSAWTSRVNETGVVYFSDKDDALNRVFMSFEQREVQDPDAIMDLTIAGMKAVRSMVLDDDGTERQDIVLRSNLYDNTEYRFWFQSTKEEFERKRAFSSILQSFHEGAEDTLLTEKNADNIEPSPLEVDEKTHAETAFDLENTDPIKPVVNTEYTNLVADGSKFHSYTSQAFGFQLRVPWRYWYRNFGGQNGHITEIGFSREGDPAEFGTDFALRIKKTNNPPSTIKEYQEGEYITIVAPRDVSTLYEMTGPAHERDAMMSIMHSIQ